MIDKMLNHELEKIGHICNLLECQEIDTGIEQRARPTKANMNFVDRESHTYVVSISFG